MAEEQQKEDGVTLTNDELANFITALRQELVSSITENNTQAMISLFNNVMPPIIERLEQIASAQITLATALQRNRRDENATNFARLLIERAMRSPEEIDKNALHLIPAEAYALANEMELHGRVAEVQADSNSKRMDEAIAKKEPLTDTKAFVDSFFGRKSDIKPPKIQANENKKKH